jgi:hypothetical protein
MHHVHITGYPEIMREAFDTELYIQAEGFDTGLDADLRRLHLKGLSDELFSMNREGAEPLESGQELHDTVLSRLDALIRKASSGECSKIICLTGSAGVGKTSLLRYYFARYRTDIGATGDRLLVLWINLKYESKVQSIYALIKESISRLHGDQFHHEIDIWLHELRDKLPGYPQNAWAREVIDEVIRKCLEDDRRVVHAFLRRWRELNLGRIYLVVDNIDTMLTGINDVVQELLAISQTAVPASPTSGPSYFDCILVPVRPETIDEYTMEKQINVQLGQQPIHNVSLLDSVRKRADFVVKKVSEEKPFVLSSRMVGPLDIQRSEIVGSYYDPPPSDFPKAFHILDVQSPAVCSKLVEKSGLVATSVFSSDRSSFPIRGARSEEARQIFKSLCGTSVRRAMQLSKAVFESPGLLITETGDKDIKPYVFLDALISWSMQPAQTPLLPPTQQTIGSVRIANLLGDVNHGGEATLLPAYGCLLLKYAPTGAAVEPTQRKIFTRTWLVERFLTLGFDRTICGLTVDNLKRWGILRPVDERTVDIFYFDSSLNEAHALLLSEGAYWDNIAQSSSRAADPGFRRTVGYDNADRLQRAKNTFGFIQWILACEHSLFRSYEIRSCLMAWTESQLPSISSLAVAAFHRRVSGLIEFFCNSGKTDEHKEFTKLAEELQAVVTSKCGCDVDTFVNSQAHQSISFLA